MRSEAGRASPEGDLDPAASAEPGTEVAIPSGTCFEGLLGFRGSAWIEGVFRGSVVSDGTLHVGPAAQVEGRVEAEDIVIAGRVEGEICAGRRIVLRSSAFVKGPLQAARFVVAEGCLVDGQFITRTGRPSSAEQGSPAYPESAQSGS